MSKAYYYNLSILRTFAIISLVAWHSYCSYICWDIIDSPANKIYAVAFGLFAPLANMPLFTLLSGYLFFSLMKEQGKYQEFVPFLRNKVNRLLIPFIVLGSLVNLCEYGKHYGDILYGTPNHLWYCLMLFFCFIISWIVEKYFQKANYLLFFISAIYALWMGSSYLCVDSILGWKNVLYFYNFFLAGLYVQKYSIIDRIEIFLNKNNVLYIVFILIYLFLGIASIKIPSLSLITSYYFIILLFCVVDLVLKNTDFFAGEKIQSFINNISMCSFGIFVFHQWIIWNLTRVPQSINFLRPFMQEHYILFPALLTIVAFSVSYALTRLCIKTKVGKYLLL